MQSTATKVKHVDTINEGFTPQSKVKDTCNPIGKTRVAYYLICKIHSFVNKGGELHFINN